MKKVFATLVASALIVPALSTSAHAGDPYPGTVDTTTKFQAPKQVEEGEKFEVTASVGAPAARVDTPCKGKFVVSITKGKKSVSKSSNTGGASKTFTFKLNDTGVWSIKASFKPAKNNPCQASSKKKPITVTN